MSEIKRASIAIMHKYTTAEDWAQKNPLLGAGELGIESNTKKFKFGDGVTPWNSLSYATRLNIEILQDGEESGTLQQFSNTTNFTITRSITDSDSITYNIDFITEEREEGIASFRTTCFGDTGHLYHGGEEPSFMARFCENYSNTEERH